jgi:hypothetical protein
MLLFPGEIVNEVNEMPIDSFIGAMGALAGALKAAKNITRPADDDREALEELLDVVRDVEEDLSTILFKPPWNGWDGGPDDGDLETEDEDDDDDDEGPAWY